MNALATTASAKIERVPGALNGFPVAVFALCWIALSSRLRFDWSINPQYSYGWAVPLLAAYLFWQRWQSAPTPSRSGVRILAGLVIILAAISLFPVRLVQEANPDWRLLSWAMTICAATITASGIYL